MAGQASWAPKLALDLEGGTQMILAPKVEGGSDITEEQLNQAVAIIRQRVDGSGVAEAEISTQSGRNVVVSLPGHPVQGNPRADPGVRGHELPARAAGRPRRSRPRGVPDPGRPAAQAHRGAHQRQRRQLDHPRGLQAVRGARLRQPVAGQAGALRPGQAAGHLRARLRRPAGDQVHPRPGGGQGHEHQGLLLPAAARRPGRRDQRVGRQHPVRRRGHRQVQGSHRAAEPVLRRRPAARPARIRSPSSPSSWTTRSSPPRGPWLSSPTAVRRSPAASPRSRRRPSPTSSASAPCRSASRSRANSRSRRPSAASSSAWACSPA